MAINKDTLEGQWKILKGKVRQKWGEFTEDEVSKMKGSTEELEGAVQKKYGCEKDEASKQVRSFIEEHSKKEK